MADIAGMVTGAVLVVPGSVLLGRLGRNDPARQAAAAPGGHYACVPAQACHWGGIGVPVMALTMIPAASSPPAGDSPTAK